jgi:enoyl-CoA hydratase
MTNTAADVTIDGPLATITLSTPDTGVNVLSTDALARLESAVDAVACAENVRFAVFRAEGKVFVAGADIKEMVNYTREDALKFGQLGSNVFDKLEQLPCVTVAAINGAALGGGLELALACDFRIAVEKARIGLPETSLGLLPGWGGIPRVTRIAGLQAAKRLIFSAAALPAIEAAKLGLIDQVVPDTDALDDAIKALGAAINTGSPAAIALVKRAMRDQNPVAAFGDCFENSESKEGMSAFLEKRPAKWTQGDS